MSRQTLALGRVAGIPLGIDYSWFLIFVLVTWSLATGYYPREFAQWPKAEYWIIGGLTSLMFFGSVLLHELGHSLTARRFNIEVRGITLYLFGGASELCQEAPTARSEFWITLAGPIVNLALAAIFWLLSLALSTAAPLLALFKYLAYINLALGLFNLIPGFPLDGGSVLMSIIWGITHKKRWGVTTASITGSIFAYLLIFVGALQLLGGNMFNGLWTAFIGWFMLSSSGGQVRRERLHELLAGHKVSEAMSRGYTIVYPQTTLQALVDEHILSGNRRFFIVKKDNAVVGMLTPHALRATPRDAWAATTVEEVMIPRDKLIKLGPDTDVWEAIEGMDRDGVNQVPVMQGEELLGVLTREDVISHLRRLQVEKEAST